jgi:hypothetical protein
MLCADCRQPHFKLKQGYLSTGKADKCPAVKLAAVHLALPHLDSLHVSLAHAYCTPIATNHTQQSADMPTCPHWRDGGSVRGCKKSRQKCSHT